MIGAAVPNASPYWQATWGGMTTCAGKGPMIPDLRS
jgi:hypothetical protein